MNPRALVRPLEARWESILDAVLRPLTRPAVKIADTARLAPRLAELSAAYNEGRAQGAKTRLPIEARVAFSFPRDVPKGAAAVREIVATGALALPADRPLRVLDLGAGLGAMSWGLARAFEAAGAKGAIEAVLVDEDAEVLRVAEAIARAESADHGERDGEARRVARQVTLSVQTRLGDVFGVVPGAPADVVFLGQVLSELDPGADPVARVTTQVRAVRALLPRLAERGVVVVVEPALRERTRHLHRVRDALLAEEPEAAIVAPCLHARPCPLLAVDGEWCHEDLAIDLPPWLAPLARAAGLRFQGLTFSYLVVRRKEANEAPLAHPPEPDRVHFRAVSELLRSKGKLELWTCSDQGLRARIRRLDRDDERGGGQGVPFGLLERGDIVTVALAHEEASAPTTRVPPSADPRQSGTGVFSDDDATAPIDERGRVAPRVEIDVGPFAG